MLALLNDVYISLTSIFSIFSLWDWWLLNVSTLILNVFVGEKNGLIYSSFLLSCECRSETFVSFAHKWMMRRMHTERDAISFADSSDGNSTSQNGCNQNATTFTLFITHFTLFWCLVHGVYCFQCLVHGVFECLVFSIHLTYIIDVI